MSTAPILVICHDVVGRHVAGPGIRARQLARVLAQHSPVILAVPGQADGIGQPVEVWPYERGRWHTLSGAAYRARAIITSGDSLMEFPALEYVGAPLVIDGYDPHTLETLALWAGEGQISQAARHGERLAILRRQCQAGDFFICASERQRDWWMGVLEDQGRIDPRSYAADPSLRRLIDVVPFGLPAEPCTFSRPVVRGIWPGVGLEDWIVLWGGGLWEWLDPLTALRAVRRLADDGYGVRLVFPGTKHPNPGVPDMPMRARALALADELHLTGRYAFFGDWVPYEDWPGVLLEADVGLSLHPDTVEARLAHRTRVLDYVWAGMPIVVTRGDWAADLVTAHGLGQVVDYGDDAAVAAGLVSLFDAGRSGLRAAYSQRFDAPRRDLSWERAAAPLVDFCREPHRAADRAPRFMISSGEVKPMPAARSDTEQPHASVVVLTWNGSDYIESCLEAVLAQEYPSFEVLVVDNFSTDGTPDLVARRFPGVRMIRNPRNLGFAAGNNVGLRAAKGDVLVLLNQDTRVHPGWLDTLVHAFDDPAVGIAGCKLLYPDGTIQHAGGFLYGPRGEADHVGRFAPDDGRFAGCADADFVTAAALAISRAALDRIGLLDEGFSPAYYEDVDWCYRARAAGLRVVYVPGAAVTHFESTATRPETHERQFAVNQGRLRLLFKHRPLDWLLSEFEPAERAWIAAMDCTEELMGARHAYFTTLLALSSILDFRHSSSEEADCLVGLLTDLRGAAVASLAALKALPQPAPQLASSEGEPEIMQECSPMQARAGYLAALEAGQVLEEQPFTSQVPVLGGLIVAIRRLCNSVSTKWYVRPIAQQQSAFNIRTAGYLRILQEQVDCLPDLTRRAGRTDSLLQRQMDEALEAERELTALADELRALKARLAEVAADQGRER